MNPAPAARRSARRLVLRGLGGCIALAVLGYLGVCAAMFAFQRSLLYFPQPGGPAEGTTVLRLPSEAGDVLVSVRERPGPRALLYFGGNAEDVSGSLPLLARAFPDHALYLMHYRGWGGSAGRPSEGGLRQDALALFERARAAHPEVTVIGRSLGSGIAIGLAAERQPARLVLVTPYDSIQELAAAAFPYLPVRWLLRDKYESWRYAPRVRAPTLLVTAEQDETIPRASSEKLLTRFAPGVAKRVVVAGAGHNSISGNAAYAAALGAAPAP